MTEGNSNKIDNNGISPEQSLSRQACRLRYHPRRGLGFGIGKYHGSYFFIWIITCLFYVGPFIFTYAIFALTAIAIFLPLYRIIRWLGC